MTAHQGGRWARWLLRAASLLVPATLRANWRRQWEADLEDGIRRGRSGGRILQFAWGSVAHALHLRREGWTMRGFGSEVRQAVRALARRPGFTALTVATLAVGIGTATTVTSLTEAVLFRPLPLPDAGALVQVASIRPTQGPGTFSVSYPDWEDIDARSDLFGSTSFFARTERDLAHGDGAPVRVAAAAVHRGFFETLRPEIVMGRALERADQEPGAEATLAISEGLWRGLFGADPDVIGRTVRLDGVPYTMVGVVADQATYPVSTQVWIPLRYGSSPPADVNRRSNHSWQVVGRLAEGVSVAVADARVRELVRLTYASDPDEQGIEATAFPLRLMTVNSAEKRLFILMGVAVLLVLVIACLNASGLLMTHVSRRAQELSLRSALGAGRGRLTAQLLVEALLMALAGGALGLLAGHQGIRMLARFGPPEMADTLDPKINGLVLGGAFALTLAATLLAGLLPALRASRATAASMLREGGARGGGSRSVRRLRNGLVIAEIALSVALLTGAGLTIRAFQSQLGADPGFQVEGLIGFSVRLPAGGYGDDGLVSAFQDRAVRGLEALPEVREASISSVLPLGGTGLRLNRVLAPANNPDPGPADLTVVRWVEADAGYLRTLGVGAVRGRGIEPGDRAGTEPVMLVSEEFARTLGEGGEVLGLSLRAQGDEDFGRTIVGVVPDLQSDGMAGPPTPVVYVPVDQSIRTSMTFLVRGEGAPGLVIPAIRSALAEIDPNVALAEMQTLEETRKAQLGGIRFIVAIFGGFGVMALILAISGVYGQVAYSVTQRTQEIGLRMAIGATAGSVQGTMVAEGARLAAVGLALGSVLALGFARLLSFALFGLSWLDPRAFGSVLLTLAIAVLLASWLPARRVTRVDPVQALRAE